MAGSDKLYLEPVLKELLDGLNASMQSIDGIVDGLGDAVAEMKSAVNGVSEMLTTVSGTLTTTNQKLDTVNNSVGQTREIITLRPGDGDLLPGFIGNFYLNIEKTGRLEQGDAICKVSSAASGIIVLFANMHGTGAVSNPGLDWIDETTNTTISILDDASSTDADYAIPVGVSAGHVYRLQVSNVGSANDLMFGSNTHSFGAGLCYMAANSDDQQNVISVVDVE